MIQGRCDLTDMRLDSPWPFPSQKRRSYSLRDGTLLGTNNQDLAGSGEDNVDGPAIRVEDTYVGQD